MPAIQLRQMHAIILYVSDLAKAQQFYAEVLGFKFSERMGSGIIMTGGGVMLFIEGGYTARQVAAREADVSVCFNVDGGVRAAYDNLKKAGVIFPAPYEEVEPGFAYLRFSDPDGNVFELSGQP